MLALLLPISIIIATIAMTAGIGGAVLFSPLFLLVYGLSPAEAFTLGIIIEVFGFASGFSAYAREKLIEYRLSGRILLAALPATIIGVALSFLLPASQLNKLFALFLLLLGGALLRKDVCLIKHPAFQEACHHWRHGKACYVPPRTNTPIALTGIVGGLLLGLFSSGVGEVNEYFFLKRLQMHNALASGTSVFIVALTALTSAAVRLLLLGAAGSTQLTPYLLWAVPGVLIGGQLGMRVAKRITNPLLMRRAVGALFLVLSTLTFLFA
ncbi:sulfite exporter TauE/SafE family protein [Candidatus Woesearchaeota archaeon]|nr:MAG: sulfite exporter TauE/SafE family protein [Candidatus Woesearchaeota archaeon]